MKKRLVTFLLAGVMIVSSVGCSLMGKTEVEYPYADQTEVIDNNLFYRNDYTLNVPDPSCIYITEGEEAGYFYVYPTTNQMHNVGYMAWRSKNLNDWEPVGIVFEPEEKSWGTSVLWAPEVIYNANDGKYYMYYSARNQYLKNVTDANYGEALMMGVAVADSPKGPFVQWTGTNADGVEIGIETAAIDIAKYADGERTWSVIDASPFFDDNGELYMYCSAGPYKNGVHVDGEGGLYGMKMKDMVTPDYTTLTQLTRVGSESIEEYVPCDYEDNTTINEAPFMVKHDGKYYLTYSAFGYTDIRYCVCQAVGDSPLGPFTKISSDIGNPVLTREAHYDHVSGTGHHSFVTAGDETFIVYHAHTSRGQTGDYSTRSLAFDRVYFKFSEELGYDILHANGPTYSVQPLPTVFSGYENVAGKATVTTENLLSGEKDYINDQLVTYHPYDYEKECVFEEKAVITLEFEKPQTVSSVLVYNSANPSYAFDSVEKIELYPTSLNAVLKEATKMSPNRLVLTCKNIPFDSDYFMEDIFIRPGAAAIAEFEPVEVNKIVITVSSKKQADVGSEIGVSEIAVLGKTSK